MAKSKENKRLTRAGLRKAAGPVYFARGERYFDQDAVHSVRERNGKVHATVYGTRPYKTSLWIDDEMIEGRCSCPLGQDSEFCKHLVATGLAFMEQKKDGAKQGKAAKYITPIEVEAHLAKKTVPDLVRIIMEQADLDEEFYAMLRLRMATDTTKPNLAEMKRVLRQAVGIHDFVSWKDTYDYSQGVDRVLGQLRTMLNPKHAAEIIEVAEYAMDLWEENIELIDDSGGCMGMIRDDIHQLHLEACKIAKPDPVELAERLSLRAINSEWEMFYDSYQAYSGIFGTAGRTRYRDIVETEWGKLPRVGRGEEDPERYGRTGTLKTMMLAFAEENNDLDMVIRIFSRDLSHSHTFLQIAQRCREARKYKLAREWAEKGMAAFTDDPDVQLRAFLADEYTRSKRPDDAMAMIWANFEARTSLESYQDLAKYARKLKCWDSWREKAFRYMRNKIKDRQAEFKNKHGDIPNGRSSTWRWMPQSPNHSLLVAVLLWEKRKDEAWAEARKGGCSEGFWLKLARHREKHHPEDAIGIYRRQVEPLIKQTRNDAYEEAVEFLGRIHGLMKRVGEEQSFIAELTRLKVEYKRKRNFIKYVEQRAWGK